MENKIVPADIQADFDKLIPKHIVSDGPHGLIDLNDKERKMYIQGRLDERNKYNHTK